MATKKNLNDVFFENELIGKIDSRFIDTKNKTLVGICSKPIPLFPVDARLFKGKEKTI
jgi:hypothetical protein